MTWWLEALLGASLAAIFGLLVQLSKSVSRNRKSIESLEQELTSVKDHNEKYEQGQREESNRLWSAINTLSIHVKEAVTELRTSVLYMGRTTDKIERMLEKMDGKIDRMR